MLYVFFGTDVVGARREAHAFLAQHEARGAGISRISSENYEENMLTEAAGSASLFGGEDVYLIDTPSERASLKEAVGEALPELARSRNTFVLIEGAVPASEKKKLTHHATDLTEVTAEKTERFNIFAFADALLARDKKSLWILLTQAYRAGVSSEEIIGTLFWQLKTLRLAQKTGSAREAGVKDFPYNKATRALGKFTDSELDRLSEDLCVLYHEGHGGVREIDLALERWVLTL